MVEPHFLPLGVIRRKLYHAAKAIGDKRLQDACRNKDYCVNALLAEIKISGKAVDVAEQFFSGMPGLEVVARAVSKYEGSELQKTVIQLLGRTLCETGDIRAVKRFAEVAERYADLEEEVADCALGFFYTNIAFNPDIESVNKAADSWLERADTNYAAKQKVAHR